MALEEEKKSQHYFSLQPGEKAVYRCAAQIFAAYIAAGRVTEKNKPDYYRIAIRDAIKIGQIVERAAEVARTDVLCVMGGFHLGRASVEKLDGIAARFDESGVAFCGASHCTGDWSIAYFMKRYGERYIPLGAGTVVKGSDLAVN